MENYEKKELASVLDFEKRKFKEARYRHTAALAADAVTNLASMYARGRGGRYSLGTNFAAQQSENLSNARENVVNAQRNYNALMTELAFRNLIDSGKKAAPIVQRPTLQASRLFAKKGAEGIASANNSMARWGKILKNR